ncbi:stage II sporulation protein D [Bacillus massilinigeriensis]|uniref:stage II sporulation protein D n=1 Tax=Bacillus mediterraneensis TaxID=1805474 RepID=UPI0008F8D637|nr:stage II sporulation protein D [Bacillus mediterraneensis]
MLKLKPLIVLSIILFAVTLLVPSILVLPFKEEKVTGKLGEMVKPDNSSKQVSTGPSSDSGVEVTVFRMAKSSLEKMTLDQYLIGVVAAEMPVDFETEALKAQALTARTYYVKQLMNPDKTGLPDGAQVSDTVTHQVFKNKDELKQQWGSEYERKMKKVADAVKETDGQILTFNDAPIEATFFSTSNGYTENSEDYWPNSFPYLRSVESPWDKKSPKFATQTVLPLGEFERKLGIKLNSGKSLGSVTARTTGKRVGKLEIAGKTFTGKEVRDKLGLKSSDFTWSLKDGNIIIDTKGFGHGVGMSQYGANGMAAEGKSYKDIVLHYYKGVQITSADGLLNKVMARK